jgi:hypothetical protein
MKKELKQAFFLRLFVFFGGFVFFVCLGIGRFVVGLGVSGLFVLF